MRQHLWKPNPDNDRAFDSACGLFGVWWWNIKGDMEDKALICADCKGRMRRYLNEATNFYGDVRHWQAVKQIYTVETLALQPDGTNRLEDFKWTSIIQYSAGLRAYARRNKDAVESIALEVMAVT